MVSLFLAWVLTAATTINANTTLRGRVLTNNNNVDDCTGNRDLWENCDDGTPKKFSDGPLQGLTYLTECPSIHMFLAPDGDCEHYWNNNDFPSPGYLYLDGDRLDTGGWDKFEKFHASTDVTFTANGYQHPAVCFRTTSCIIFKGFELNGKYIAATNYASFSDKSLEGGNVPALQNGGIGYVEDGEWLKYAVGYLPKGTYAVKYYLSRLQASCTNPHLPPCPTPPPATCSRNPTPAPSTAPTTLQPSVVETPTSAPVASTAPTTLQPSVVETPTSAPVASTAPTTLQPSVVETPTSAPVASTAPTTLQPSSVETPTSPPAPVASTAPTTLQPSVVETPTSAPVGCPTSCTVTDGGLSFSGICSP